MTSSPAAALTTIAAALALWVALTPGVNADPRHCPGQVAASVPGAWWSFLEVGADPVVHMDAMSKDFLAAWVVRGPLTDHVVAAEYDVAEGCRNWLNAYDIVGRQLHITKMAYAGGGAAHIFGTGIPVGAVGVKTFVIRIDLGGGQQESVRWLPDNGYLTSTANDFLRGSDGTVFVAGRQSLSGTDSGSASIGYVAAYAIAEGREIWRVPLTVESASTTATRLGMADYGKQLYVAGYAKRSGRASEYVLSAVTTSGHLNWTTSLGFAGDGYAHDVHMSKDARSVFVAGNRGVAAFNSTTGALLWAANLTHGRDDSHAAYHVLASWRPQSNAVVFVGETRVGGEARLALEARDGTDGTWLWSLAATGGLALSPAAVGIADLGSKLVVAGHGRHGESEAALTYVWDLQDARLVATHAFEGTTQGSPAVTNIAAQRCRGGVVVAGNADPGIFLALHTPEPPKPGSWCGFGGPMAPAPVGPTLSMSPTEIPSANIGASGVGALAAALWRSRRRAP